MGIIDFGGLQVRFLQSKDSTAGSLDLFEMTVQPGARMPVPHYHESWDEAVYGLTGIVTFRIDGMDHPIGPGQTAFIKRGIIHGFRNESGAPATCLSVLTPGKLGPAYFEEMAAEARNGAPDPSKLTAIMLRYGLIPAP